MSTGPPTERALLVGVQVKGQTSLWNLEESLEELALLARTAGAEVAGVVGQRVNRPTSHYVGRGKLEEISQRAVDDNCTVAIFDDELTPGTATKPRKRAELQGNRSHRPYPGHLWPPRPHPGRSTTGRAGATPVPPAATGGPVVPPGEAGRWIGTRGPGESQLETDRRLIRRRVQKLEEQLQVVRRRRASSVSRRKQARLPVVSFVGYTNAGKSTLFNRLSNAGVVVQDQLFSTLDPVTRRIWLPGGGQALITDTVGFIHKQPPTVVAAFKATLEELHEADLLLHVIDITHPKAPEQTEVVEDTLRELGLSEKPWLLAVNKMDLLGESQNGQREAELPALSKYPSVLVSAALGWNLDMLLGEIESRLSDLGLLRPAAWPVKA